MKTILKKEFDGMWESLIYEPGLKRRLLRYAQTALLFTEKGVDPFLVSWNRIVLLHGPPGTGKTSLYVAFVDRADIKAYIGPQTLQARYEILRSSLQELIRTGILTKSQDSEELALPSYANAREKLSILPPESEAAKLYQKLIEAAKSCEGLSGRSLRKLPFLAYSTLADPSNCEADRFLSAMIQTATRERSELPD